MPSQTILDYDYSFMSMEELLAEAKGLEDDLEEAQLREKQILHDMDKIQEELLRRLQAEKAMQKMEENNE